MIHEALGIEVFLDKHRLKSGYIYSEEIFNFIRTANTFVFCWSENAAQSEYVQKERKAALELAYASKAKTAGPTHEQIIRDVRAGKIAPIYYLMGTESYYIDRLADFLVSSLLKPEERDFNLVTLFGAETQIDEVILAAKAFPMGAPYTVVLVREAQNLEGIERLEFYCKQPQPTTVLIICHKNGTLDRRLKVTSVIEKGGRISKTVAFAGGLLNIKPVITVVDGEIQVIGKARGSKQGNNLLVQKIHESGGIDFDEPIILGYSGLSDSYLKKYVEDSRDIWQDKADSLDSTLICSVIGTHTGPGVVAVAFFKKG